MSVKIKNRIIELTKKIKKLNYEYYELNNSQIDDSEFDNLLKELINLEKEYPQYKIEDSPTNKVGGYLNEKFSKYKHKFPMLSLGNAFNSEDMFSFEKTIIKEIGEHKFSFFVEPKIDGLSISLIYSFGKLIKGVTRGDGVFGEDVTENIFQIATIPKEINNDLEYFEVRGEIYLPISEFNKINLEKSKNNEPLFANPRNAAAGTLRQLDSKIVAERKLNIWVYYLMDRETIHSHSESLKILKTLGFQINQLGKKCKTIQECIEHIELLNEQREELEYEIDGVVIKVDEYKYYDEIGYTSKFPKWAIAYKLPAEIKETLLLEIFPTVGRTGKITYNAKLQEVILAGTRVQAATLHNSDFILSREIKIGARVKVKKAGDIIPEVISVVKDENFKNLNNWTETLRCPECDSFLQRIENEVDQYCLNDLCEKRILKSLEHFSSRVAMNIEGLSEKILFKLFKNKFLNNFADIYKIKNYKKEIVQLDKIGNKLFDNLITSIENSKKNSAEKLLFALGIRHVGKKTAQVILEEYKNIKKLNNLKIDDLEKIRDVGSTVAKTMVEWFSNKKNIELINELENVGVNLKYIENDKKFFNENISNKIFVITGTLSKSRNYYRDILLLNGAKVVDSVSKNTDYVLYGESAGSKLDKAKKINVKIINEEEFLHLLGEE